jgi:CheY-like chemotaxis protein
MKALTYTRHPFIETFTKVYYEMTNKLLQEKDALSHLKIKKELNILLADDDDDDRELFAEVIQEFSQKVTVQPVRNGVELLEYLCACETLPDLIFLDLNMPCMNGKECLKEIKKYDRFAHIPVIMYSTSSHPKDVESAYQFGADYYIVKPNTFHDLKELVKKVCRMDFGQSFFQSSFEKFVLK